MVPNLTRHREPRSAPPPPCRPAAGNARFPRPLSDRKASTRAAQGGWGPEVDLDGPLQGHGRSFLILILQLLLKNRCGETPGASLR